MSGTLQLVEPVKTPEKDPVPQFLVNWSSRWEEFFTSIKPALARSEARLAGEAPFGLIPFRVMMPSYIVEAFLVMAVIFIKVKVDELRPYSRRDFPATTSFITPATSFRGPRILVALRPVKRDGLVETSRIIARRRLRSRVADRLCRRWWMLRI